MHTYNESIKEKLILVVAEMAAFDGWSEKTLKKATLKAGVSFREAKSLFPRGGIDLAKFYHQYKDQCFLSNFKDFEITNLSHSEKVELALKMRFKVIEGDKEAFRRSIALFATPMYQLEAINLIWSTCDLIWIGIGDKSFDLTWYTKRIILVSIYLSALLFFIGDDSIDNKETEDFIIRRMQDVGKIGKLKPNFDEFFKKLIIIFR